MDLGKSFTYIFDDEDWLGKVGITLLVSLGAGFSVLIFGLVFVAALFGWTIELMQNMRDGVEKPMPSWNNFGEKMSRGWNPLIASVVYSLPAMFLVCVFVVFPAMMFGGGVDEDTAGMISVAAICCLVPIMILYAIAFGMFFSVGLIEYSHTGKLNSFFRFGPHYRLMVRNRNATGTFILYYFVVSMAMGVLQSTGIGGIVALALQPAITGHILGQYAMALEDGKAKRGS